MEVSVKIDFSESTQDFISKLFASMNSNTAQKFAEIPKEAKEAKEAKEEKKAKQVEKAEKEAEDGNNPYPTLEMLRAALQKKVNNYRADIKQKLTEFNAQSLTTLSEEHYGDMYNFLNSL